ncbi:MAG: phosphate acyltransferase PlsX [Phycisphaeraceae bacterium]|nr:phosphate acyltransferase PlsX [Phycisphaeraceae bacterium]
MRIGIDAMGGDNAPDAVIRGVLAALPELSPEDRVALVGPRNIVERSLREAGLPVGAPIDVVHAPEVITMDDKPAQAVRAKPESSIVELARMGSKRADDPVDVVLSAGNTGACVSAAIMHMRRLPGVHRPGVAVTIPAFHGPVVLCDAGANTTPLATHLFQYGLMAEVYAKRVHSIENPRIATMNIGAEEGKGSGLVRDAHQMFKAARDIRYVGFIEGRDLFDGGADVVVTEGFVGNTMLKMAEGLASSIFRALVHELSGVDPALGRQFQPIVERLYKKNDYHEYGGAPLLGVNGAFMIAHGSSQPRTIRAAIRNCRDFVAAGVNDAIRLRLEPYATTVPTGEST